MKKPCTAPPYYNQLGQPNYCRFLVRDIIGDECADWIADVCPERPTIGHGGFPLKLARRWKFSEAAAAINEIIQEGSYTEPEAAALWSVQQFELLSRMTRHPVTLKVVDKLHYDPSLGTWFKRENVSMQQVVFNGLRHGGASWPNLKGRTLKFFAKRTQYLEEERTVPAHTGSPTTPLSTDEAGHLLPGKLGPDQGSTVRGFLNTQHALLPVYDLIALLELEGRTAEAAREIVSFTHGVLAPVAHTLLIRPRREWVIALKIRTQWSETEIATSVQDLGERLVAAGVRPIIANEPAISARTPLHTVAALVGEGLISSEKMQLLARTEIQTLADLLQASPSTLVQHTPLMPSDVGRLKQGLGALGYTYSFNESDLITQ